MKWEYLVVEVQNPDPKPDYEGNLRDYTIFKINGKQQRGDQWLADNIPDELNKLGEEGWELIKIGRANSGGWSVMYTFRRPL